MDKNDYISTSQLTLRGTDYTRIPRVVNITGAYKYWDNEIQSPPPASTSRKTSCCSTLKRIHVRRRAMGKRETQLFRLAMGDCFKQLKEEEQKKEETKVLTVLQLIEARIGWPATAHAPSRRTTTRTQSRMSYANA